MKFFFILMSENPPEYSLPDSQKLYETISQMQLALGQSTTQLANLTLLYNSCAKEKITSDVQIQDLKTVIRIREEEISQFKKEIEEYEKYIIYQFRKIRLIEEKLKSMGCHLKEKCPMEPPANLHSKLQKYK